jgi:hypothetical protein
MFHGIQCVRIDIIHAYPNTADDVINGQFCQLCHRSGPAISNKVSGVMMDFWIDLVRRRRPRGYWHTESLREQEQRRHRNVGVSVRYGLAGLMPGHGVGTGDCDVTQHPPGIPVTNWSMMAADHHHHRTSPHPHTTRRQREVEGTMGVA